MRKFAVIASLLFCVGVVSFAKIEYQPLQNVEMASYHQKMISIPYKGIEYDIYLEFFSQNGSYKFAYVEDTVVTASNYILRFAEDKGVYNKSPECVPNHNLEVYDVDWKVLNDSSIFNGEFAPSNIGKFGIQGLYDPRTKEVEVASITLTGRTKAGVVREVKQRNNLIGHEMAHYWYDRLCFNRDWNGTVEDFALEFEKFYSKEVGR
jgi:hypothetical protein